MNWLNPVIIKKNVVLLAIPLFSVIAFYFGIVFLGFVWAMIILVGYLFIGWLLGIKLLKTPLRDLEEGQGLLMIDWTSKGILKNFIVKLVGKRVIRGTLDGQEIAEVFDRECTQYLATPVNVRQPVHYFNDQEGKKFMAIFLSEEEYNDAKFMFNTYPTIMYNSIIGTIVNKRGLADKEKDYAAEHLIVYVKMLVEELMTRMMEFTRVSVDSILKPRKKNILGQWWLWLIIFVIIIVAIWVGYPYLSQVFGGVGQGIINTMPQQAPTP